MTYAIEGWRRFLSVILLISFLGMEGELFLLEHTDGFWQVVPMVLLALGTLSLAAVMTRPGPAALRLLRIIMLACVASGAVGVYLHYVGNAAFELEIVPSAGGWDLFRESLMGATPALAPGAMLQFGLLGLVYAFRHPGSAGTDTTGIPEG